MNAPPWTIPLPGAPAPIEALRRLRGFPHRVLLETVNPAGPDSRGSAPATGRSFLAADPIGVLTSRGGRASARGALRGIDALEGLDPFAALERLMELACPLDAAGGALSGGASSGGAKSGESPSGGSLADRPSGGAAGGCFGYLAYEAGDVLERLPPPPATDAPDLPDSWFGVFPWVITWEAGCELRGRLLPGMDPERLVRALEAVRDAVLGKGSEPTSRGVRTAWSARSGGSASSRSALTPSAPTSAQAQTTPAFRLEGRPDAFSSMGRAGFCSGVERIRDYIRAGDLFQANLTHRITRATSLDGEALLARLRSESPAPFVAYLDTGDGEVISVSPESFLELRGREVVTRPIKGTARRGGAPDEDLRRAAELEASEKDRAENVMIVDLLRNDLSRVCAPGTVTVPSLLRLERHPTVHHLVSTVRGELREGAGVVDLLRATFPGGSITGAPKIRAMEILRELEPVRRGVYTGALGMLGVGGDATLSIAIRTAVLRDGLATYGCGGGITLASDAEAEWEETLDKAAAFLRATDP